MHIGSSGFSSVEYKIMGDYAVNKVNENYYGTHPNTDSGFGKTNVIRREI